MKKMIIAAVCVLMALSGCGKGNDRGASVVCENTLSDITDGKELHFASSDDSSADEPSSSSQIAETSNSDRETSWETDVPLPTAAVDWEEEPAGDWCMVLVNAVTPTEVDFSVNLVNYNEDIQVDKRIIAPLTAMMKAAANDGVSIYPCSSYRSPERSAYLLNQQIEKYLACGYTQEEAEIVAAHWVAPPGTSEHHTGLALDFLSNDCTEMDEVFADSDAGKWLKEHAAEYGFVLRYPDGKEQITGIVFEPWHYRYVGREAAAIIMANGLTLEEYLGAPSVGYEYLEEEHE